MEKMQAATVHHFGGADVIEIETVDRPDPGPHECLVRVHAASVNPVDYKIRSGKYPAVGADKLPVVLGRDLSGTVVACGDRVDNLKEGDDVWAMLDQSKGAYAEYATVGPAEAAPKPAPLDHVHAAAVPLAGLTAWQGLFDHGGLRRGQRVLIHGGAGGVGHLAVQLAKARGAYVCTTVSARDMEFARDLGADEVIDYRAQRFEDTVQDMDLVFDLVAGDTQSRSWAVLKRGGMLVSTLSQPSEDEARKHGAHGTRYMVQPNASQLREIGKLVDEGKLCPMVEDAFPLERAKAAQEHLERDHVRGKVVLEVAG